MKNGITAPFLIYNASAGAGKTHTLVHSFLFRLLSNPYPNEAQRLLAITFTNKAAQEMKDRILDQLALFASDLESAKTDKMFHELAQDIQLSDSALHQRAKQAYTFILHHFGQLNVVTIDKLTHQIIRTFARDLGLHPKFDVALDAKGFMAEVVARVLSKAGEDKPLTEVLIAYVLQKADNLKSWDVTNEVTNIAEMYLNENHMSSLTALADLPFSAFSELDQLLLEQTTELKGPITAKAKSLLEQFERLGLEDRLFPYKQLPKLLEQLAAADWSKPLYKLGTLSKNLLTGQFLNASASQGESTAFAPFVDPITELLNEYDHFWRKLELLSLLRKNIVPLSLMRRIGQEVTAMQEERNTRLLGFFNKHIADNIKDTATPFIYERLGVRYRHFFVDEFQDTSVMQWSNLTPLFSHALEGEQKDGSLVIVGDAKQSIYRWRGGDPEQFMSLAASKSPFSIKGQVVPLPKNYRSAAEIISFNNGFFTKAAKALPTKAQQKLYIDACSQEQNEKKGGYISLTTVNGATKEERYVAYQHEVVQRVQNCLEFGHQPQDICVLVRKNDQGVAVATALTQAQVPITSSESLLISQSKEVNFLVALVKLGQDPSNDTAKYTVLERFVVDQQDPYQWSVEHLAQSTHRVLTSLSQNRFELSVFQQMSLYASLEYAIWAFELTDELTAHLQGFLDEVLKLEAKKEATVTQFLAHWEEHQDKWTVRPPEKRNAVQVMTTHKAKGLAFPVVIVPFADSKWMDGNTKYAWFPLPKDEYAPFEEMLLPVSSTLSELGAGAKHTYDTMYAQSVMDTVNTLYVAMTRPVQELHIVTQVGKSPEKPKGLGDIFLHAFPDLANQNIAFGQRNKPSNTKKKTAIGSITPWLFHLSHLTQAMAVAQPKSEEAQYGLLFHEVMAKIDVPQDLSFALAQSRAKQKLSISAFKRLQHQIGQIIYHKELAEFFSSSNRVFCERPLLTETGMIIRPDRFVLTPNKEALLLDYKTGQYDQNHKRQILEYASCLEKKGHKVKRNILVYTEKKLVLKEV
ncbi:MAG: UvrD-helicase domain-containing protein [Flavobacteriaceae bacterium]